MKVLFRDDLRPSRVLDFLAGPRLWVPGGAYPDYADWLARIEPELAAGDKRHVACEWDGQLAGLVVWQRHKSSPTWLEIKNLSVRRECEGRLVAAFLLRQAEVEGRRQFQSELAVCDAKRSNAAVLGFLVSRQYRVLGVDDLYGLGAGDDVVLGRSLADLRAHAAG